MPAPTSRRVMIRRSSVLILEPSTCCEMTDSRSMSSFFIGAIRVDSSADRRPCRADTSPPVDTLRRTRFMANLLISATRIFDAPADRRSRRALLYDGMMERLGAEIAKIADSVSGLILARGRTDPWLDRPLTKALMVPSDTLVALTSEVASDISLTVMPSERKN